MNETSVKPQITAPNPEGVPEQLRRRPQWIVWRMELRGEKWTKVPYCPGGNKASTTDLITWRTFEDAMNAIYGAEALEALGISPYDGIGFVFCSADPYVGIDLDNCRDPDNGVIEPWARGVINSFSEAHTEISPSGKGVHIIAHGELEECAKVGPIEMYDEKRFFTVTGVPI
jgi:putative DNA primase/helicase